MDAPVVDESQRQDEAQTTQDTEHSSEESRPAEPRPPATPQAQVSVEHRPRLAAVLGLVAAVVTVAWFSRALQTGEVVDWLVCAALALVGLVQLAVLRDSRAPLLVADDQGVRLRHGVTWSGLRWQDIDHVELDGLRPATDSAREVPFAWLRGDGRIVVHPRLPEDDAEAVLETFAIPLSATTRVVSVGLTGDLLADLDLLSSGRAPVVVLPRRVQADEDLAQDADLSEAETDPAPEAGPVEVEAETDPAPEAGPVEVEAEVEEAQEKAPRKIWRRARKAVGEEDEPDLRPHPEDTLEEEDPVDAEEFEPVAPARPPAPAVRAEVVRESVRVVANGSAIPAQRHAGETVHARVPERGPVDETVGGPIVDPLVDPLGEPVRDLEPFRTHPAADPVIGPMVAAARRRARLSIDELSERTRIRPHVLESIEVDDFEPCGGDFYARGHLRTLARIFGLDAQELLDLYDERYAQGEIEARQVFEAELATGIGGGVRATASGPRWSLLAAAVIAIALVWGGARIFTDTPKELVSPAPGVVDSAGLASGKKAETPKTTLAPLAFTAVGASPQVVVRDRSGRILWAGQLAEGQHQQVIGEAPFDVTTSNGAAVKVSYLGKPRGTVGSTSAADSRRFG